MLFQRTRYALFRLLLGALVLLPGSGAMTAAAANRISLPGITFSQASDNFRLLAASGTGSLDDPFVLVEEVFGDGEVVVAIEIETADFGSRVETMHAVGFALQKVVINRTATVWDYYALELEFESGRGSDYFDGLSFAQMATVNRPFRSDRFAQVEDLTEPRDVIRFSQGHVSPGDRVRFALAITHTGIQPKFFLVQHVRPPYAQLEMPFRLVECTVFSAPGGIAQCHR